MSTENDRPRPESEGVEDPLREGVLIGASSQIRLTAGEGTGRPVDAGAVLGFREISERGPHEQAAQDALAYAEGILATLREPFVVLDGALRVQTANASFYEGFRVTKEETEGRFLEELGDGQWNIPRLRTLLEASPPTKLLLVQDFEVEHNFPTIGPRIMQLNARRFPQGQGGEPAAPILLAIEDVTERRRAERQAKAQLEASAELHRRKDAFLAMLSHELRNPLSPILNAVHLLRLQDGEEDPIQEEARGVIERQVGQLTRLVDDLLEVARISTGRIRLRAERLDMRHVVERAVESARPLIDRRRHQLTVTVPSEPLWLKADPARMEQVVVNLLNNAAKYTDEGGRIWLHAREEMDHMVLSVRDTGIGINLDRFPEIFDLFAQADRSLDRSQGGLGIGLSLVQQLVEMHLGTVAAYSEGLGAGSEFTVRIPLPQLDPLANAPPSRPERRVSAGTPR